MSKDRAELTYIKVLKFYIQILFVEIMKVVVLYKQYNGYPKDYFFFLNLKLSHL